MDEVAAVRRAQLNSLVSLIVWAGGRGGKPSGGPPEPPAPRPAGSD